MVAKRAHPGAMSAAAANDIEVVAATATPTPRTSTISIALPSSILQNAQSPELRMYVAGQVARAAAIYCIDEIIIFTEGTPGGFAPPQRGPPRRAAALSSTAATELFTTVLSYVDTPQYLRKHLFPMSAQLRLVGLLNPLALPSHLSRHEYCRWREGVAAARGGPSAPPRAGPPTRYVDVGLDRLVEVDTPVPAGTRVTVDLSASGDDPTYANCPGKHLYGSVVGRDAPSRADGTYWGYKVRTAPTLADVFSPSHVCKRYDLVLGTSERGAVLGVAADSSKHGVLHALPRFKHALIVFGGVQGLEYAARGDTRLRELGIGRDDNGDGGGVDVGDLFDFYINTCPAQGSRTIRTEEAILITLAALAPYLRSSAGENRG